MTFIQIILIIIILFLLFTPFGWAIIVLTIGTISYTLVSILEWIIDILHKFKRKKKL